MYVCSYVCFRHPFHSKIEISMTCFRLFTSSLAYNKYISRDRRILATLHLISLQLLKPHYMELFSHVVCTPNSLPLDGITRDHFICLNTTQHNFTITDVGSTRINACHTFANHYTLLSIRSLITPKILGIWSLITPRYQITKYAHVTSYQVTYYAQVTSYQVTNYAQVARYQVTNYAHVTSYQVTNYAQVTRYQVTNYAQVTRYEITNYVLVTIGINSLITSMLHVIFTY